MSPQGAASGRLVCQQALLHGGVGGVNEIGEGSGIDVGFGPEFHVAHELAGTFEQAIGISDVGAAKEADIDVRCEGIDVGECRVADTGGRMAVVQ